MFFSSNEYYEHYKTFFFPIRDHIIKAVFPNLYFVFYFKLYIV